MMKRVLKYPYVQVKMEIVNFPLIYRCRAETEQADNTIELLKSIEENIKRLTGKQPTTVINNLHRSKMDADANVNEATFQESLAKTAWNEYQNCIKKAEDVIKGDGGFETLGLFIEIHGHEHSKEWTELGKFY